jgi:hypothetical protein
VGAARYDSLQVKAETKSARHGLYALLGYTWARNFDSGLTDGLGTNAGAIFWPLPGTQKLDWGLSQLNVNDTFTASILYDLPLGKGKRYGSNWGGVANAVLGNWQVNLIERAESGFPLFVVDSANTGPTFTNLQPADGNTGTYLNYNFFSFNRPDLIGDPNGKHCLPNTFFNTCAFGHAPGGELGTAPRAPIYGPRFVNTDFSIMKDLPLSLREGMKVQFRAEFFNLFNHPQFFLGGIGATGMQDINSGSSFGFVNTQLNNPRLIQFALRLNF